MKKYYESPSVKEIEINSESVVAASIEKGDGELDPGQAWSNRRRPTNDWDNIWNN